MRESRGAARRVAQRPSELAAGVETAVCLQCICAPDKTDRQTVMTVLGYSECCGVVEAAVLSIDCYFESPADGTAVSVRDEAFGELCHSQAERRGDGFVGGGCWRGILGSFHRI